MKEKYLEVSEAKFAWYVALGFSSGATVLHVLIKNDVIEGNLHIYCLKATYLKKIKAFKSRAVTYC